MTLSADLLVPRRFWGKSMPQSGRPSVDISQGESPPAPPSTDADSLGIHMPGFARCPFRTVGTHAQIKIGVRPRRTHGNEQRARAAPTSTRSSISTVIRNRADVGHVGAGACHVGDITPPTQRLSNGSLVGHDNDDNHGGAVTWTLPHPHSTNREGHRSLERASDLPGYRPILERAYGQCLMTLDHDPRRQTGHPVARAIMIGR